MAGSISSEDGDVGFQIAPMVDVVFVLMLFFMASAGMQSVERMFETKLPAGPGTDNPPTIIAISADGQVSMNGKEFDNPGDRRLPELRAWLKETVEQFGTDSPMPVIIAPAAEARHERIVDVLGAASAAGIVNLTFS